MIVADELDFPMNVIAQLKMAIQQIDVDLIVVCRPLRSTDTIQSVGIFPTDWEPDATSKEMRGQKLMGGQRYHEQFPTLSEYNISIQSLVTDTDEERGIAVHSALSKRIRATVARNPALQIALAQLSSDVSGHREMYRAHEVRRQRYLTMELQGTWLYMSVTQFWIQTESR